jgi:hypothetical protein
LYKRLVHVLTLTLFVVAQFTAIMPEARAASQPARWLPRHSRPLPSLAFNATAAVGFAVTSNGGEQAFYAEIVAGGPDSSAVNNIATLVIGKLSAPVMVEVYASEEWVDGLDVA